MAHGGDGVTRDGVGSDTGLSLVGQRERARLARTNREREREKQRDRDGLDKTKQNKTRSK